MGVRVDGACGGDFYFGGGDVGHLREFGLEREAVRFQLGGRVGGGQFRGRGQELFHDGQSGVLGTVPEVVTRPPERFPRDFVERGAELAIVVGDVRRFDREGLADDFLVHYSSLA